MSGFPRGGSCSNADVGVRRRRCVAAGPLGRKVRRVQHRRDERLQGEGSAAMTEITRRRLMQYGAGAGAGLVMWRFGGRPGVRRGPGRHVDPRASQVRYAAGNSPGDAAQRRSLPGKGKGQSTTTGSRCASSASTSSAEHAAAADQGLELRLRGSPDTFNYPAFTIEANGAAGPRQMGQRPGRRDGKFRPHLLPIDQTLHWANPPGARARDMARHRAGALHGAGADRHPPPRRPHVRGQRRLPGGLVPARRERTSPPATHRRARGTNASRTKAASRLGSAVDAGHARRSSTPTISAAATLWYHDHTLGMTRVNVHAGPAAFYLLRGGPGDDGRPAAPRSGAGGRRPARTVTTSRSRS